MGFIDTLSRFFSKKNTGLSTYTGGYVASSPMQTLYQSDYVLSAIHTICEEASKMVIHSVNKRNDVVTKNKDSINDVFRRRPNLLMTTKDMLYWTAYQLETRSNAYWLPVFKIVTYGDGSRKRKLTSIYPINSTQEEMIFENNQYYLIFQMESGSIYKVKYDEIIHIRKHYGDSFYFGSQDRTSLLKRLNVIKDIEEALPKAIRASIELKGIVTAKSQINQGNLEKFRDDFEKSMNSSKNGVATIGTDGEFHQLTSNPQVIDKDLMSTLKESVNEVFGVSSRIIKGEGTEDDWNALYQRNIEPLKIAIEQAATSVLFTEFEIAHGNEIKIYDKLVQNLPMKTRLEMIKLMGPSGYLSRAEQRELLGYEPDGKEDRVSLNYVNEGNLDKYQLTKKKSSKEDE